MNFWKPDSSALTGALSEFVQSPTKSNDTLDYSSDGSTSETSTPPLPDSIKEKEAVCEITVIEESKPENVEAMSIEEVHTDEGPPIALDQENLSSFKKREIKCRNIRKSSESRQRTVSPPQRRKSVEKSKHKYPANWAEYKELGLNVQKHLALKSKLLKTPQDTKFEFQKFFNFETPSPPTEAFKYHSKSVAVWIEFPYLRCTATKPPIIYSDKRRGHLTRQQLFALIPKNRQQAIEKLMKPSRTEFDDCKPLTVRKWFSKNWTKTDKVETKLLENSVGLSFLRTYSDEENAAGNLVSQTPPFAEEKEEGEVSDDDSHNQSISVVEEVKEIKKNKEELQKNETNKEELEKLEESLTTTVSEGLVKVDNEVPIIIETKKKRKKVKANKVSKSVKSKKKTKKKKNSKSDDDSKRKRKVKKKKKNLKDKDSKQKKKSTTKSDSKKNKKNKPVDTKPAKLEFHPDYQDDIQFFADRLDAERQLKGKTKHKTKINISLEEFSLDKDNELTSTEKKDEVKVDLLKMNEEYLREQKRKNSKERSCSKEKSKKEDLKKEVDSVLENIKQEPNSWESEEEILIDNQLVGGGTPNSKPLDLEMPLNIKSYCRRDIEKDNKDLGFDIPTTPKKGRWDIQTSTPTKKVEELTVLEDEYEEFMKAVTDTIVIDSSFEEIKPVPAPSSKTIQKPLINLSLSANVTQNITVSVSAPSSVQISTPNSVTLSKENVTSISVPTQNAALGQGDIMNISIPNLGEDVKNLSIPPIDNVATSESLSHIDQNVAKIPEEIKLDPVPILPIDEEPANVATSDKDIINVPDIINFSIPASNEAIMNLSIPRSDVVYNPVDQNFTNKDSNNIDKDIMNFSIPTKTIPVTINHCTDKDAFNIPLDKDIDTIECEWKQTFKPIMLPMKNLLGSSKLNLEDFDGHNETFETLIEENEVKRREASPKREVNKNKDSTSRKQTSSRREDSPIRRRRDSSPRRKRSPLKRHNSPRSRRSFSPKRRRRTPSPRKKSKYSPSRDKKRSPRRLSPSKHLPDSTISDDQLPQIAHALAREKPHEDSPQRLPLDIRINQVLGLEVQQPAPEQFYQYPDNFASVPARPQLQSTYKQVGNMLQIVPVEQEPPQQETYKQFQPPNPPPQPRSQIRQIGNMLEIVPTEMVPVEPPQPQVEIKTEKVDEDFWYSSNEVDSKLSAEAAMLQKEAERLTERENRRTEREKRKKEKERRRKEREKSRQTKLKAKNEKMIKRALELEIDQMLQEPQETPAPLVNHFSDFKGRSILVNKLSSLDFDKSNKTVQFADGIRPGEGTSPSAGEELYTSPPPNLPKEKRFKKTLFGKTKGKKKTKPIKKPPPPVESDSGDDQPPPPPPPGSPPPHIFPPRIKVKPVNNVPAALLASIIQTAQQQQYQQFRPTINMMMAPPPPLPQGHHSQSPSLPPVSPQLHASLAVPLPPPPQPGHSRHF